MRPRANAESDTVGNRDVTFRDDRTSHGSRLQRGSSITGPALLRSPEVAESGSSCGPPWTWTSVRTAAPVLRGPSGGGWVETKRFDPHTPPGLASFVDRTTRPLRDDRRCRRRRFFTTVAGRDHHIFQVVCSKIALPPGDLLRSPLPETATRPPSVPACHRQSSFRPRGVPPPRRVPPPERCVCVATRCRP